MPINSFTVKVTIKRGGALLAQGFRLLDFTKAFEAVMERWRQHNADKFEAAKGAESTGVSFSGDSNWLPLTKPYKAAKRRAGYDDHLMVRTGELMESLTGDNLSFGWFEEVSQTSATFGTVLKKAEWNRGSRPVMFLDAQDQAMIEEMFGAYVGGEPPFKEFAESESRRLDAEFQQAMAHG